MSLVLKKINIFLFILLITLLLILSYYSISVSDDFWHAYFINKINHLPFSPFIWTYGQYLHWTGRFFISFMQGILIFNPSYSYIGSFINISFFIFIILYEIKVQTSKSLFAHNTIIIFLTILGLNLNVIGEAIYWMSAIYIWPLFLFILAKEKLLKADEINYGSKYHIVFWLVLFFCLGNSIELLFLPTLYLFYISKNKRLKTKYFLYFLGLFVLGFIINLIAPGNVAHIKTEKTNFDLSAQFNNIIYIFQKILTLLSWWNILLIFLLLFTIPTNTLQNLKHHQNKLKENFFIATLSIVILIPIFGFATNRTYLYFFIFFSLCLYHLAQIIRSKYLPFLERKTKLCHFLLTSFLVVFNILFLINIFDAKTVKDSFNKQQEEIVNLAKSSKTISVTSHQKPEKFNVLYYTYLSKYPNEWPNIARSKFYSVDQIVIK